jgi:YHS domain-containing protein
MTRKILLFLSAFVLGAFATVIARSVLFDPHAGHQPATPAREYSQLVDNTPAKALAAATTADAPPPAPAPAAEQPVKDSSVAADPHAGHSAAVPEAKPSAPVNTVCAICGMDVDPSLPTELYKGKAIGFGCRMCPQTFKSDPDRYGPYYLRNEVIKR